MKVWQIFAGLAIGFVLSFFIPEWVTFALVFLLLLTAWLLAVRKERKQQRPRPLVLCIDNSGSMMGPGSKWARDLIVILKERCQRAGRTLHVLHYDHGAPTTRTYPDGSGDLWWPPHPYGGTRFDLVLIEAMRLAKPGGHIMFVTDGMAPIEGEWLTKFNEDRAKWNVAVDSWLLSTTSPTMDAARLLKFSRNSTTVTLNSNPSAIANKAQEA